MEILIIQLGVNARGLATRDQRRIAGPQVTLGRDGAFQAMRKGALYIDHTTVSARIARPWAEDRASTGSAR